MAVTKSITLVRTTPTTMFPPLDPAVAEHNRVTYGLTGKSLGHSREISPDRLTLVVSLSFINQAAADEYSNDPVNVASMQDAMTYAAANNITIIQS